MKNPGKLLLQAGAIVVMATFVLLVPGPVRASASMFCGDGCVDVCTGDDGQCADIFGPECPTSFGCTYNPSCDLLTNGVAISCGTT